MNTSSFTSSRILLPVRPWFIFFSLFLSVLFNFLPTAAWYWIPDWVALLLIFWAIHERRWVGMGCAFLLGLVMDVANAALLGQHALAYVLATYLAASLARRILWFSLLQQALHALPLLLLVQTVQLLMRMLSGGEFPGYSYFMGPFVGVLCWWPVTFILLLPQHQPADRDHNRPL